MPTATLAPTRPPAGPPQAARPPEHGLGFGLFLLVNLALFVRPSDFIPALYGVEIYQYVILACFAASLPAVLGRLTPESLEKSPIDVLVMLWLPVIGVSLVVNSLWLEAFEESFAYFKVLVYYLLFISLVTTSGRLRTFTSCLVVYASVMTLMAILNYYKVIELPRPIDHFGRNLVIDEERMYGPGIFYDPNDVCIIIVAALLLLFGKLADGRGGIGRVLWLPALAVLGFGFYLTQSRGGMLALLLGLAVMARLRWGWGRVLLLAAAGVPLLAFMVLFRQTAQSGGADTGQARVQLWNEGLVMFRGSPVFGVGMNQYPTYAYQVAHNSYMQAFGDTGLVGGTLFLGMVVLAVSGMYLLGVPRRIGGLVKKPTILDPDYRQMYPFVAGAIAAYAAGMLTLTMNTLVTTYTFLAMASVFLDRAATSPAVPRRKFELGLLLKLAVLSVLYLGGMFVFIRLTFRP